MEAKKMSYYKIDNFRFSLCWGISTAKELYEARKQHLKVTSIKWFCYDVEINPTYIDATYEKKFPVLLFLN